MNEKYQTQEDEGEEENKREIYADFYNVVGQIEQYYYTMIQLWHKHEKFKLRYNKENKAMMRDIQAYIYTLKDLFINFKKLREDERAKEAIDLIDSFETESKKMNYKALKKHKDDIVYCHYYFGLGNLEKGRTEEDYQRPDQEW